MSKPTSAPNKLASRERQAARVTIIDAVDLDSEIQRILKDQLLKIVHSISPLFSKWEPELDTILRLVVWKLSVRQFNATFGQQLLSLKYSGEVSPPRAAAWAALSIGVQYIGQRTKELTRLLVQPSYHDQVSRAVGWVELGLQIANMFNFLVFLQQGRFPTLPDRLVGMKAVTTAPTYLRMVGYRHMTRELLWHGFIELIVFILPLVNYKYMFHWGRKWLGLQKTRPSRPEALVYSATSKCTVCEEPPVLPHHMGCSHAFCYYCLQLNRVTDTKFECPACGHSTEDPAAVQPVTTKNCTDL